ncbi:uncharacterized protein RHO25_010284 [Cercospora beticola]|uniref:Uncharacterized protein n=1 Tax=Cercospora beticola TaxID=122368 RepID=A0ABZ0P1L8_CERBT|nr:hypothetical protein RHO25_010284 [Cercospora beticola]
MGPSPLRPRGVNPTFWVDLMNIVLTIATSILLFLVVIFAAVFLFKFCNDTIRNRNKEIEESKTRKQLESLVTETRRLLQAIEDARMNRRIDELQADLEDSSLKLEDLGKEPYAGQACATQLRVGKGMLLRI